jgi:drug/metabolite transporter (DMT)-like permease
VGGRGRTKEDALGLNAREQRALSRIAEEFARTAPALVSFLHFFNRLTFDEAMPPRRPLRRLRKKLSTKTLAWMFVSVWGFITAGMLTFALILSHTTPASAATVCSASSVLVPGCGGQVKPPPAQPKGQ